MLDRVCKRHKEWIEMAISVGSPPCLAGDIIQEVYLRLHKYQETAEPKLIANDGSVNTFYMFGVIRNTVRTELRKEGKYVGFPEFYYEEAPEGADKEFESRYQDLMTEIKEEADSWGAYNSKLFNLYFKTDFSMRNIAQGTGIGLTHIYTSITKYRENIKEKFNDDFNNLKD
jgi:DNA-directed RNA polymerase specialized sigma24 family protein